jgi:hypothetical protein
VRMTDIVIDGVITEFVVWDRDRLAEPCDIDVAIGDIVTCVSKTGHIRPCIVLREAQWGGDSGIPSGYAQTTREALAKSQEGVDWCRDASGPAVEALLSAQALK